MPDETTRNAAISSEPYYDMHLNRWVPQCPHGDVCTGCDAAGRCTRVGLDDAENERSWSYELAQMKEHDLDA